MPYSRIVLTQERLDEITSSLARKIEFAYRDYENCLALVVLEGARPFSDTLLAKLDFPMDVGYIRANSYSGASSTGIVTLSGNDTLNEKIRGKNILLIDDIYDTGLTLYRLLEWVQQCDPMDIKTCVLLEKQIPHVENIAIDFLGAPIEDEFLIGYGLDFNGQYRDLPFIGVLSEDIINSNLDASAP